MSMGSLSSHAERSNCVLEQIVYAIKSAHGFLQATKDSVQDL